MQDLCRLKTKKLSEIKAINKNYEVENAKLIEEIEDVLQQ